MMLSKFDINVWEELLGELKFVKFVSKIEVVTKEGVSVAVLDNNKKIDYIKYGNIRNNYGRDTLIKAKTIMDIDYIIYKLSDVVYLRCDELELACSNMNMLATKFIELGISDYDENVYDALSNAYYSYGYDFIYKGYHIHAVTEDEIF